MKRRTFYFTEDEIVFDSLAKAKKHETKMKERVSIPLVLLQEMIAHCTPYMVLAKQRYDLKERLEKWLPKK